MLSPEIQQQLSGIGSADVVIGIPSYNSAQTIGPVLEAIRAGLSKYFLHARVVLVNSDAGSTDGTPALIAGAEWEVARVLARHESPPGERVAIPYHGIPGRAAAQRTVLEAAAQLEAKACALVGPDYASMTPDWIDLLLRPVLEEGYDYVAPLYQRHRYDGTLTNGLISPLIRAVFGKRIRHPVGGQNGLSGRLVGHLCAQKVWGMDATRQGVDLWMTATAVTAGFQVCEAWLGPCVIESQGRAADLSTTFAQAVGSAFALLDQTADAWGDIRGSAPVPVVGTALPLRVEPVELNGPGMIRAFRLGLKDLLPLWEQVLSPDTLAEVLSLGPLPDEAFRFPHDLWARVVYDFALGYHFRTLHRHHLLRSLVPLYLGRTATFIQNTLKGGARETEIWVERSCLAFERQKAYLVERWR